MKSLGFVSAFSISEYLQRLVLHYGIQEQFALDALRQWFDVFDIQYEQPFALKNEPANLAATKLEVGSIVTAKVKAIIESTLIMDIGIPGERALMRINEWNYGAANDVHVGSQTVAIIESFVSDTDYPCWVLSAKIPKKIKEGDRLVGTVSKVYPEGVFVDLGGFQFGFIHIFDLAWKRVTSVTDHVKINDQIEVLVLRVKPNGRILLSRKLPELDPWNNIKKYNGNAILNGEITRVQQFGFFVDILDGVTGLVHMSEYPPETQYSEGQIVRVSIKNIDEEKRRVSLHLIC